MKTITPKGFGAPMGMYSYGVVAPGGELVVVAGQTGTSPAGHLAAGDIVAQTKQALENVRAVVEAGGCAMRDVIRLQTFLTRAGDIPGFMSARSEVFPRYFPDSVYPPNTLLVISGLARPEMLVEIEAAAVRPRKAAAVRPRKAQAARAPQKVKARRRPRR